MSCPTCEWLGEGAPSRSLPRLGAGLGAAGGAAAGGVGGEGGRAGGGAEAGPSRATPTPPARAGRKPGVGTTGTGTGRSGSWKRPAEDGDTGRHSGYLSHTHTGRVRDSAAVRSTPAAGEPTQQYRHPQHCHVWGSTPDAPYRFNLNSKHL